MSLNFNYNQLHNIKNPLKADFKSKSQTILQQIILFSRTVMQMICAWHKMWTLSGRLYIIIAHAQCSVDEKKIYIFRVHHIRIIAKQKLVHTTWNRECLNNHCQECVRAYISMIVYLFVMRSWSAIIGTKQPKVNQSPQQWRGR